VTLEMVLMWIALAAYAGATAVFGFGVTFFKDTLIKRALLVATIGLGAQVVSLGVRWARVGHGPYLGFYEVANALVLCAVAFFVIAAWRNSRLSAAGIGIMPVALLLLGVCGRAGADRQIVLDLRGQRPGRGLAGLFLGILALPIAAGILANQAFSLRYTMVAFVPFLLVLAVGIQCFAAPARRHGMLALVVVLGLLNGLAQTNDSRTQASRFAKLLAAQAEPGDVVAFCPDQLGPAVHRLLPGFGDQVVFPTMGSAERVDWVDYGQRNQSASVPTFADELNRRAAGHQVWLIWAAGYKTATPQCRTLQASLTELRPRHQVVLDPNNSFERAQLVDFQP